MGHDAKYSYVPATIKTKTEFYAHVLENLRALLHEADGEKQNWVSALSSVSSVLYNSFSDFGLCFGSQNRINWCGFYIIPGLLPQASAASPEEQVYSPPHLLVGPYHGRPGCLRIPLNRKKKGVCADSFDRKASVIVQNVHLVPGHIACDGTTESEIVVPLLYGTSGGRTIAAGVLDIDCQKPDVWDADDQQGLENIVQWIMSKDGVVDWESLEVPKQ